MGRGDGADEWADFFLNAACCAASAKAWPSAWRGRGVCRLCWSRCRDSQPRCTATGRPSFSAIQSATARQLQCFAPSGAGPANAARSSSCCSADNIRGARHAVVCCRMTMPSGPSALYHLGDRPDPGPRVAGALGDRRRRLSPGQQPADLPPGPFVRLVRRPLPLLQILDAQVRRQPSSSRHAPTRQGPSRKPYELVAKALLSNRLTLEECPVLSQLPIVEQW